MMRFVYSIFVFVIVLAGCKTDNEIQETPEDSTEELDKMEFKRLSEEETGIDFINKIQETNEFNYYTFEYVYNGAGVATGDINNDGLVDIFFTGNQVSDRLYLNKGGLKFEDITESAFDVDLSEGWHTGVSMADVNNDGYLDFYICRSGLDDSDDLTNLLLINNQNNTFSERAEEYGIQGNAHSTHSAFFDADLDGDLDLYVMNHPANKLRNAKDVFQLKEWRTKGDDADVFYLNEDGKFIDNTDKSGIQTNTFGLGLGIADLNQDGYPDIYVCSDYQGPDFMFMNNGDGTFSNQINQRTNHISNFSMGNDIADINNDGFVDVFSLDMASEDHIRSKRNMGGMSTENFNIIVEIGYHYQYMFNALQLNNGNGTFSEIAQLSGVSKTDWSWAPLIADFDNDGYKDIFVTNGYRREMRDNDYLLSHTRKVQNNEPIDPLKELSLVPTTKIKNYIYQNKGDLKFEKRMVDWGMDNPINSNGAAYADLDNDGDLDLILNNMDEASFVYENTLKTSNNFIQFELIGKEQNKDAFGAKVYLKNGDEIQFQELQPSRGYISSVDQIIHFGLGEVNQNIDVVVEWPGGQISEYKGLDLNKRHVLNAGENSIASNYLKPRQENKFMREITDSLFTFKQTEIPFNDFESEVLIPNQMSKLGPFISTGDANGDGLDDFYISGSLKHSGSLFIQTKNGFKIKNGPWSKHSFMEEMESVFFDSDNDGDQDLLVVGGSNEFTANSEYVLPKLYENDGKGNFTDVSENKLPRIPICGQDIAVGDIDNDGDWDVFLGGRQVPGYYPFTPKSYLFLNEGGVFKDVTAQSPDLIGPGMVTDALFDDFNGDGSLDLIVVGEWMPVSFFANNNGRFSNVTQNFNPNKDIGWFYSIEKGDFNADGKNDYLIGNLGENNKFHPTFDKPLEIYVNDFDGNGTNDIVLGKYQNNICYPVRGRQCSSQQMPFIKDKFPTYTDFATANIQNIYGADKLEKGLHFSATKFESFVMLSSGNAYQMEELPVEAQFAPINKFIVKDINNDGNLDVILVGNNFSTEVETVRYDSGRGLVMLGDGKGKLSPVAPNVSGFFENNDCKDMALVKVGAKEMIITVSNSAKAKSFILK